MHEPRDVVFIDRLRLRMMIGLEPHEREAPQAVLVSVRMEVDPALRRAGGFVSYAPVVERLRALAAGGAHVDLVETLAETAARIALEDAGVERVEVTVAKPDIFPEAEAVGITIRMGQGG